MERVRQQNEQASYIDANERRPRVYDEAAHAASRQSTPSPGKAAQIFYKKQGEAVEGSEEAPEELLEYVEGRDDHYQGPALKRAQERAARQPQIPEGVFVQGRGEYANVSSSENEAVYYAEHDGVYDPNTS
jgi:hypothetical protein